MALNLAVFAGARLFLPVTLAGAAGIVIAAGSNWLVNNRMTFRSAVPAQVVLPAERAA
jgi:putative flippase GtrA